jgi:anti-sigma B factor antagonist
VTLTNIEQFKTAMSQFMECDSEQLVLNIASVKYMNSAALGIIAECVVTARKQKKELVIAHISEPLKEIFFIVKFATFIKLFATEKEAVQYLEKSF